VQLKNYDFGTTIDPKFTSGFGVDTSGQFNSVADALTGTGALSNGGGWTFITAPEDVSWDVANAANRVEMFGTNNPPVVAGSRGMRDLTLGNSLVEGFVRGVTIEGKVAALEALMSYGLNSSDGFVSVPVYQVWANNKSYGGSEAYYIIKDVRVKEAMRDLQGNATRAYVDISLMQVPAYQVNSGRDQASKTTSGGKSGLLSAIDGRNAQQAANNQVDGAKQSNVRNPANRTGATVSKPDQTTPSSTGKPLRPTQSAGYNPVPQQPEQ
jgi:hypothetical protein